MGGEKVPIWVGDYVLGSYGTGAVMAVPAHDSRDFEFAKTFNLDIKWVVKPIAGKIDMDKAFTDLGVAIDSGEFDGLSSDDCKTAVTKKLEKISKGGPQTTY